MTVIVALAVSVGCSADSDEDAWSGYEEAVEWGAEVDVSVRGRTAFTVRPYARSDGHPCVAYMSEHAAGSRCFGR